MPSERASGHTELMGLGGSPSAFIPPRLAGATGQAQEARLEGCLEDPALKHLSQPRAGFSILFHYCPPKETF